MKQVHKLIAMSSLGLCMTIAANAADSRTALIIGLSTFENPAIPVLTGVPYDIQSAKLIAQKMGIPEARIKVLRDSEATKQNILKELSLLGDATDEGARSFVYFSGHGTRYLDELAGGCVEGLLSYDQQAITNQEFAKATQKLAGKADKSIVMIDACHSQGVVPPKSVTRSVSGVSFTPKYFLNSKAALNTCSQPSNQRTRGLVSEAIKIGALQENFIQITSSRADEVSFDEPGKGGIATQALRDCMLGEAKDLNKSGAVTLDEIQQCAQDSVNRKLQNAVGVTPHHITISGTRNLIPVPVQVPVQVVANAPQVASSVAAAPAKPTASSSPAVAVLAQTPVVATNSVSASQLMQVVPMVSEPPELQPFQVSLATLKDIEGQSNPKRKVDVKLNKTLLKIGKDSLDLAVRSSHDGYVQMILLGSDAKSFYVLFPNGLDKDNKIRAGQTLKLPKPDWQVKSSGPAGTNQLLVMVTDTPRKLDKLSMAEPTASAPFTFSLTDLSGRAALLDFLIGTGVDGRSESFGAKIVAIKEVP